MLTSQIVCKYWLKVMARSRKCRQNLTVATPDSGALQQAQTASQRRFAEADLQPVQQPSVAYQRRGTTVTVRWTAGPGPVSPRRDLANLLTQRSGLKSRKARQIQTEMGAFRLFISADILFVGV